MFAIVMFPNIGIFGMFWVPAAINTLNTVKCKIHVTQTTDNYIKQHLLKLKTMK